LTVGGDLAPSLDELGSALAADERRIVTRRATLSRKRFGRLAEVVQLDHTWDPATAYRVALDIIAERALPRRYVDYSGPAYLEAYDVGDRVLLSDASLAITDAYAVIRDMVVGGPDVLLSLQLLDDPAQSPEAA
jgi:hypothetical protein